MNYTTINVSMDVSAALNYSHHVLMYSTYPLDQQTDNVTSDAADVNITRTFSRLSSPLAVTVAVLLVFLFSPMILIGNSLVLVAMYRLVG